MGYPTSTDHPNERDSELTSRRKFLKGVVASGGLSDLAQAQSGTPAARLQTQAAVSALPPDLSSIPILAEGE